MNWTSQKTNSKVFYHEQNLRVPNPYFKSYDFYQCQSTPNEKFNWNEVKKKDQDFIKQFLSNLSEKKAIEKAKVPLKICEAKEKFLNIIALKKSIEEECSAIKVEDDDFDSKWVLIEQQMNQISEKLFELVSNTDILKKNLLKRLKKRNAQKRKKLKWLNMRKESKKKIEEKNIIIDKILSEKKNEVEEIKREAALKRQADTVLHEVRRKKYKGQKMINMLLALAKLRDLRIKEEEKNGRYCSKQLTEVFNEVINRFKDLWEKQIEVYKLEEKGLKIMLEESAVPKAKEVEFELNILEWEKLLFGDALRYKNKEILPNIENDLQAFIQVRRDWDQYITKEPTTLSSSIPLGWVIPPETENEDWKQFLVRTENLKLQNF